MNKYTYKILQGSINSEGLYHVLVFRGKRAVGSIYMGGPAGDYTALRTREQCHEAAVEWMRENFHYYDHWNPAYWNDLKAPQWLEHSEKA